MSGNKVLVILAEGFEEIEAVTPVDVLRRLGVPVVVAGLNSLDVFGSHGICVETECSLINVDASEFNMVILPGGMPGSKHLKDSDEVVALVKKVYEAGGYVAALCAAPIVLARAGLIDGLRVTAYPSVESMLGAAVYTGTTAETDGRIITAKGPGAVFEFSRHIAVALGLGKEVEEVLELMFV